MNGGIGDFEAGGELVDENAAGDLFQKREDESGLTFVGGGEVEGGSELAFEVFGDFGSLGEGGAEHEEGAGAEDFGLEFGVFDEVRGGDAEDGRVAFEGVGGVEMRGDAGLGGEGTEFLEVVGSDTWGEHGAAGLGLHRFGVGADEEIIFVFWADEDDEARVGAELADAHGGGVCEGGGECFGVGGDEMGKDEAGIDAAHFGEDGDGDGPSLGECVEG